MSHRTNGEPKGPAVMQRKAKEHDNSMAPASQVNSNEAATPTQDHINIIVKTKSTPRVDSNINARQQRHQSTLIVKHQHHDAKQQQHNRETIATPKSNHSRPQPGHRQITARPLRAHNPPSPCHRQTIEDQGRLRHCRHCGRNGQTGVGMVGPGNTLPASGYLCPILQNEVS